MTGQFLSVYYGWIEAFEKLSSAELGRLMLGALKYSAQGETPEFPGNERFMWPIIKSQIDEDNAHRSEVSEKRKASGALSHSKRNQMLPNATNSNQLEANVADSDLRKESTKEKKYTNNTKKFIPPTVDQVAEYCKERKNNIDPEHFVDYYSSNGWKVGKSSMKDWKATVRNWEKMQKERQLPSPPKKPNKYTTAAEYTAPNASVSTDELYARVAQI